MRAPISVIIPVLDAAAALPACLAALMEGLEAGVIREVILTDGGSTDDSQRIGDAVGAVWVTGAPSRGGQLRRGAAAAAGDWLMVLHADTVLPDGWSAAALTHMEGGGGAAGYFDLSFDAKSLAPRLVAGWANLRASRFGLPYGDQGLLISRALYDAVGGYGDMPLMEDVAMARALGRARVRPLGAVVRTSARRYATEGYLRRGGRNLILLLRFLCGADPQRLARAYRPKDRSS
ncbi:glycosyl transferase [Rhodobacterales bacterium 59_46_T64]|nr:glycosyl transferase [Rhodobacterales bacterium 59_46_T64]